MILKANSHFMKAENVLLDVLDGNQRCFYRLVGEVLTVGDTAVKDSLPALPKDTAMAIGPGYEIKQTVLFWLKMP